MINPNKKSDYIVRDLHCSHGKFDTLTETKINLMDEFGSLLPPKTEFQLGYFFGKQSTKFWLMCQEDLYTMNECVENLKVVSCYGRSTDQPSGFINKKRHQKTPFQQNNSKLKQSWTLFWKIYSPNMGTNTLYPSCVARQEWLVRESENIDTILVFDNQPKKSKRTSLTDAITGAAATFANAVESRGSIMQLSISGDFLS